ncbi:hypothetical protein K438DRAFT_1759139 [Mycena galopus ATCC 62051]|nr:hypothetical protein K438DRAFT_1759139 [Mycena galopus ATCC 62051]
MFKVSKIRKIPTTARGPEPIGFNHQNGACLRKIQARHNLCKTRKKLFFREDNETAHLDELRLLVEHQVPQHWGRRNAGGHISHGLAFWDNVGRDTLHVNMNSRVICLCGNADRSQLRPQQAAAFSAEFLPKIASGEYKYTEDITRGLDKGRDVILAVQKGSNTGRARVLVTDEEFDLSSDGMVAIHIYMRIPIPNN